MGEMGILYSMNNCKTYTLLSGQREIIYLGKYGKTIRKVKKEKKKTIMKTNRMKI